MYINRRIRINVALIENCQKLIKILKKCIIIVINYDENINYAKINVNLQQILNMRSCKIESKQLSKSICLTKSTFDHVI